MTPTKFLTPTPNFTMFEFELLCEWGLNLTRQLLLSVSPELQGCYLAVSSWLVSQNMLAMVLVGVVMLLQVRKIS